MKDVLKQLKAISTAVMYAAEARDLEDVLERIADAARELIKTKYAALGVPDGRGGLEYFKTSGMTDDEEALISHRPRGNGMIGAIMRERKVIRLNDMTGDPRTSGFPANHPEMNSFLGAPIIVANHLYGMLYLTDKLNGDPFTEEDETLVETLAGYAALAIAGAQLSQSKSQLNLLEERERIAMQLHDGVIQSLYGIGMQVDLMRRNGETVENHHLDGLVSNLNDVIEDIRSFIGNLRRRETPLTVKEYFEYLRDRLHPPRSVDIQIEAPETYPSFSPAAFESICLIANEAMSNAIRHADASHIGVFVEQNSQRGTFEVVVADNGRGFDMVSADKGSGLGLRNMRQRARLYGGSVNIESQQDEGTTLKINIPLGLY
ncbi:MAG: GAF domain-containing protein [Chloroflexota bacterium]